MNGRRKTPQTSPPIRWGHPGCSKVRRSVITFFFMFTACNTTLAWDSADRNPTHPTHTYLTDCAINRIGDRVPELKRYRAQLVEGANEELHELTVRGKKYGIDLDAKRIEHQGTNAGADDVAGWWRDSLTAYRAGRKKQSYFILGILLHMVQDMGVPAHANGIYHQGSLTEFDNFEFMALSNWKPSFSAINRRNPKFKQPWKYYGFSQKWTSGDAPNYRGRDNFSKTWFFASSAERRLLRNRQGRTCIVVKWTLESAISAFQIR